MVNACESNEVKKRTSKGKQKIEIKKIEKKSARQVAFCKRRSGLFTKCEKLRTEFGSDYAVITFSEAGNPFVTGSPSADSVIHRFLDDSRGNVVVGCEPSTSCLSSNDNWWDAPIDDMSLDELERFKVALEGLRKDVVSRVNQDTRVNDTLTIGFGCTNASTGGNNIINFGCPNSNTVQESGETIDVRCSDASNGFHLSDFCNGNMYVGSYNSHLGVGASNGEVEEVVSRVEPSYDTEIVEANCVHETCERSDLGCNDASQLIRLSDLCGEYTEHYDIGSCTTNLCSVEDGGTYKASKDDELFDFCNELEEIISRGDQINESTESTHDASDGVHLSETAESVNDGSNSTNLSGVEEACERFDFGGKEGSVEGKVSDYYEWMDTSMTEIYPELLPVDGCFFDMVSCC